MVKTDVGRGRRSVEHQETKFSFVYNEVKQRILNGQVLPGNSLPSSRMLCDQYHVSRYTVNRVFDALKKDGLIEIQPRLAPVVLDGEKMPGSEHILRDILKKREGLVQIYRTWTLILPPLLVFATQNCSLEMMPLINRRCAYRALVSQPAAGVRFLLSTGTY